MKRVLLLLLLALAFAASAQTLGVNGRDVEGLTLGLVSGISYAPAAEYADAMGARMAIDYGAGLVSLQMGGRLVVLDTFGEPGQAVAESVTMRVNGEPRRAPGGVFHDGRLYLPVSAVAQAFLGHVSYVAEQERVMVVLPRGRLSELDVRRGRDADRLIITLSAHVPYSAYLNEPLSALELRFERTDLGSVREQEGGAFLERATAMSSRGMTQVRVRMGEDTGYRIYTAPQDRGYQLIVDLFERPEVEVEETPAPRVVLDAAHGGDDGGMDLGASKESMRVLEFSRALARALESRGMRVELSRSGDYSLPLASRSGSGVGADLFISLHIHPNPDGSLRVYYLDEADGAASLDLAVRQNAEAELEEATDALRRRLLLNLVPDVEIGRRYAHGLHGELYSAASVRVAEPRPAPLAVLAGAAGRGLLLELPAEEASEQLVDGLARVVEVLLGGGRR